MLLELQNVSLWFGDFLALNQISLRVNPREKIGIVGVNGAGKSTLLRVINGEIEDIEGECIKSKNLSIGYLKQNSSLSATATLYEEAAKAFDYLKEVEEELKKIEGEIEKGNFEHETRYSQLQGYYEQQDGYQREYKIEHILTGMGFDASTYTKKTSQLSGGEKTRLSLCKLILSSPDLLILDEPTNHLDFKTILWLENYILEYPKAVIVVSHDRYFLDKTVGRIFELEKRKLQSYKGNYSQYIKQKEDRISRHILEYAAQQEEIKKLEEYVAKNMARVSTSKMAKSRQKTLEKMERIPPPHYGKKTARVQFLVGQNPYKELLSVKQVDILIPKAEGNITLMKELSFSMERGEKIGIVGENGTGKTTFLKMIIGQKFVDKGEIQLGKNVSVGYFDQEQKELDGSKTVFEQIREENPGMSDFQIRSHLAKVLFHGEDIHKRISDLSGGEKGKLAFARLMLRSTNLLVLDEPTNHLDLHTREVIEEGLKTYSGSILFVSHDRYLLEKIADKIIEFTPNGMVVYPKGFKELEDSMGKLSLTFQKEKGEKKVKHLPKEDKKTRAKKRQRLKELEDKIAILEKRIMEIEEEMLLPEFYEDFKLVEVKTQELAETKEELEEKTEEILFLWEG